MHINEGVSREEPGARTCIHDTSGLTWASPLHSAAAQAASGSPSGRRAFVAIASVLAMSAVLTGCALQPSSADTELGRRIDQGPRLVVAGEQLNVGLLRRFYAGHGFEPVWTTREAQANSLMKAVLSAGDHGLAPELFHARLLRGKTTLPPLDRELIRSDAFLSYADALARGAVPIERRRDDQALTPEPIDVATVLDTAIDSSDPRAVIEELAPTTPTYRALRQALRSYRSGVAGDRGVSSNRLRVIEVNLERQRWLPRRLPADRVWANAADARVVLYRANQPVFSSRAIVGQDVRAKQTPEFQATIDGVLFNPPWNIPGDIATAEILPRLNRDPNYLKRLNIIRLPNGGLQQQPGLLAGLGLIKFEMENRFDVYLHDTPNKALFNRDNRRISHGCIRVENPRELAALLMQQPIETVNSAIATGNTNRGRLTQPVPVFVVYQTAFLDTNGTLQFRPDDYDRDAEVWARLRGTKAAVPHHLLVNPNVGEEISP